MSKILIKLFLLILLYNLSTESGVMVYDSQYFYCNGRMYVDNNYLRSSEINSICSKITSDDRFVILFTNKDYLTTEYSYTSASENFLNTQCLYTSINCKYDFAISIFINGGKVIITSGSIAKNIVNQSNRMNVINNMIIYLKSGDYYSAIENAITQLIRLFYQNGGNRYNDQKGNNKGGHSTFVFLFFLTIICCCCCGCYYLYQNQQKSNEELKYTQIFESSNPVGENYDTNNSNNYDKALIIHNHLTALEKMISEIQANDPPIKNTNLCLICMQPIINTAGTIGTGNTRFSCKHVYHSSCLGMHNIRTCLMCMDDSSNYPTVTQNYYDTQVVDENQIKNLIKHLSIIYPPQQLKVYAEAYPQQYNSFNDGLLMGMLASTWFMPPPVVVVNNGPGYYPPPQDNYGGYNQPMYGGDPNPDSAVGGFQPTNVEMSDLNSGNNNQNAMGNFGGYGNHDNVISNTGDFGNDGGSYGDTGGDF